MDKPYFMYVLLTEDDTLYCGYTDDVEKRFEKHKIGLGAKYTKSHHAEKIEAAWRTKDKSLACKLEYQIKQLEKAQKEKLIKGERLSTYLKGKIDCRRYYRVEKNKGK